MSPQCLGVDWYVCCVSKRERLIRDGGERLRDGGGGRKGRGREAERERAEGERGGRESLRERERVHKIRICNHRLSETYPAADCRNR